MTKLRDCEATMETLAQQYRSVLHDETPGSLDRWKAFIRDNMLSKSVTLNNSTGWDCYSVIFKDASVFGHSSQHDESLKDNWLYTCYHTRESWNYLKGVFE